ncbi:MAG: hypothetical protein AAB949_00025 [Patescibacteria group bacterium]
MSKKQIIILIALILIAALAFGVYYFYFRPKLAEQRGGVGAPPTAQPTGGEVITPADEKLKQLSQVISISPAIGANGKMVKFVGKEGGIYEVDFDGQNLKENKFTALKNLIRVLWSQDKTSFIGIYDGDGVKKISYYDTSKQTATPFNSSVRQIAFSEKENKAAYHYFDGSLESSSIVISDPNGENPKTIFRTRLGELRLDWINESKIAVSTIPTGLAENTLWILDINTQKLRSILPNIYGLTVKWSRSGENFIFAQTDSKGKNLTLSTANQTGTQTNRLDVTTLPEKCVFTKDDQSIICAAPKETLDIIWPDDYYKKLYSAQEQIWEIGMDGKKKDMLYEFSTNDFDATNLLLSEDENYLVFLNRKDGYVYSLKLK